MTPDNCQMMCRDCNRERAINKAGLARIHTKGWESGKRQRGELYEKIGKFKQICKKNLKIAFCAFKIEKNVL